MNRAIVLSALFLVAACTADTEAAPSAYAASLASGDAALILDLVNYPGTDLDVLDRAVGLDGRAAHGILAARDGADQVAPSSDDMPFTSIEELDSVPYVGDAAFTKLRTYALAHPVPSGEIVEGVTFTGWQSQAVMWGVNDGSLADLDALLDARAASSLFAHRPYATVAAMGPQAYVGTSALTALRDHAAAWWTAMHAGSPTLAGNFDGVVFDEATARTSLEIASLATQDQLVAHGVAVSIATKIVGARPFATLAAVSALPGVGTMTMSALKGYAIGGTWSAPSAPTGASACISAFDASVQPHLADLLLMSESDRELDLVSFPGAGATAPTAASVLALVHAEAGSTSLLRGVDDFYMTLEPSSGTADPLAAPAVQAAVTAQLTDVVYVAVFKPRSDPYHAEVDVYLVGRTSCGDLVGLHSIAVET